MAIRKFSECNLTGGKKKFAEGISSFDPTKITSGTLIAWFDASDTTTITLNGSAVAAWADKSGNGLDVVQATASAQPAYITDTLSTGYPSVRFGANGSDFTDFLLNTNVTQITSTSVAPPIYQLAVMSPYYIAANNYHFGIVQQNVANGIHILINSSNDLSGYRLSTLGSTINSLTSVNLQANDIFIAEFQCRASGGYIRHNASATSTANYNMNMDANGDYTRLVLAGRTTGGAPAGYLFQYVLIQGDISVDDQEKLQGWAAWTTGQQDLLPINHPYKTGAP